MLSANMIYIKRVFSLQLLLSLFIPSHYAVEWGILIHQDFLFSSAREEHCIDSVAIGAWHGQVLAVKRLF